tara:strand:+ start:150 stop:1115 length:966 start_codon:yes stop_codon:yes gene_type:complete
LQRAFNEHNEKETHMTDKKTRKKNVKNTLQARAMLVGVKQSGVRKRVKVDEVTYFVDQEYGSEEGSGQYNAELYGKHSPLKPVGKVWRHWYDHSHIHMTTMWESKMRLIAKPGLSNWKAVATEMKVEHDAMRDKIASNWDAIIQAAEEFQGQRKWALLKHLYPTAEQFVAQTKVDIVIRPIPNVQDLRTSLSEVEVQEVERQLRETHMEGVKDVYERLRDATAHVGERFANGKRKSDAILGDATKLVAALEGLNIPDADGNVDEDLERIGTEIAGELLDKNLDEVWKDDDLKKEKVSKANEITEELDSKIKDLDDKLKGYI